MKREKNEAVAYFLLYFHSALFLFGLWVCGESVDAQV